MSPTMKHKRQVVITGMGTVNGLGTSCGVFWENLIAGRSAISEIRGFDSSAWRTHLGCEVTGPLVDGDFPDKVYRFITTAAEEALQQAGLGLDADKTAVVIGTLQGGIQVLEAIMEEQVKTGEKYDIRACHPIYQHSGLARFLAKRFDFYGPVVTSSIACAASGGAISRAFDLIRMGYVDSALTGGADEFSRANFSGFNAMRSAAGEHCRPFSKQREGLVVGEGAGILVLESLESALTRGAKPLAVISGTGLSSDACHITAPDPSGRGAVTAMAAALRDAGLQPSDIDYVNAHGTGTPQNDQMETLAIKQVFGQRAYQIPVSSIKAAVGHCMGAAGAVEAVASVMTLQHQTVPPTIQFVPGDPACDLDYVPNKAATVSVYHIMSNSFGFAGNNACLIFSGMEAAGHG